MASLALGLAVLDKRSFSERRDEIHKAAVLELGYVTGLAKGFLQIGAYQDVSEALRAWGVANGSTVELTLISKKTGVILGGYQRSQSARNPETFKALIDYSIRGQAELILVRDFLSVYEERRQFQQQMVLILVVFGVALAIFVRLGQRRNVESLLLKARTDELSRANEYLRDQIEQRRAAELALKKEKELAEVTLYSIGDGVITTDLDGKIELFNAVAESLTGWTASNAWGLKIGTVLKLVHEDTGEPLPDPIKRAFSQSNAQSRDDRTVLVARDGTRHAIHESASPIRSHDGATLGYIIVFQDVTEKRELMDKIVWQAHHDVLTDLPNRALLGDRLAQALANASRHDQLLAVCLVDLDGFKPINDNYGHNVGDALLRQVAMRLKDAVRSGDTVARLGGDEFVILLTELNLLEGLEPAVTRVLDAMSEPFTCEENLIYLTISMGVTVYPSDQADVDGLLRHADHAMYLVKQSGRNGYRMFDTIQEQEIRVRRELVDEFHAAMLNGDLRLFYQPKVELLTGKVVGFEALLRWQHAERGTILPEEFLAAIEHTELVVELGEWVVVTALNAIATLQTRNWELPISVNISARHLQQQDFVDRLKAKFALFPTVPPQLLELEILESGAMQDIHSARSVVVACQEMGVAVSLDDFGTGYSSLTYLKELPAQVIKIDRSFVCDMLVDEDDLALVAGVISLARAFGRRVVAEGVESPEHGLVLMRLGCDHAQGFSVARPMPFATVESWLENFQPNPLWVQWRNLEWDLHDVPILSARRASRLLADNVARAVLSMQVFHGAETVSRVQTFQGWCLGFGKDRHGELPELRATSEASTRFHERIDHLRVLCLEGAWQAAMAALPQLESERAAYERELDSLLLAVAGVGRG